MGADRLTEVLDATYICLTKYGVRRTTMDDIAAQAGVSRSALYLYVRNKDDAFRQLAERLHTRALDRARCFAGLDATDDATDDAAAPAAELAEVAERIHAVLAAKLDLVLQLAGDSPHTAELLDAKARLFGDICHTFTDNLRTLLTRLLAEAGIPNSADVADICIALVAGLEPRPESRRLLASATSALLAGFRGEGRA